MDLKIGSSIFNLRKEQGVTQEQLANAVGVSTSAVSKWENGNAYPDITLLPSIARFFKVSTDILLCFEKTITREQVMEINRVCSEKFEKEPFDTAIAYCDQCLHEYPDNLFLKFRIAGTLQWYFSGTESEEQRAGAVRKAIGLFEQSAKSTDLQVSLASQAALGSLYIMTGEYDNAEGILTAMPKAEVNPDMLLPALYLMQGKKEQALKLEQQNLYKNIYGTFLSLTGMTTLSRKTERVDTAIILADTQRALIRLFQLEKYMLLSNCILYLGIYTDLRDSELTLKYLEEYVECIKGLDFSKWDFSEIVFFDAMENKEPMVSANFTREGLIRDLISDPRYDFIREDDRYQALAAGLKKFIE